jgi:hypothetical protein
MEGTEMSNEKLMTEIELRQKGEGLLHYANNILVVDQSSMNAANDFVISTRSGKKKVSDFFREIRENAHKTWKAICNKEKGITDIFDQADAIASKKIIIYREEERLKAAEAQKKADQERIVREQKERERLLKQAEKAKEKGNTEKAELLFEQAAEVHAAPTVVEPSVKKTEVSNMGRVTFPTDYDVTVINAIAIIRAVASGELPESILEIKESKIKNWARINKIENYNKNGLRVFKTERLVAKEEEKTC